MGPMKPYYLVNKLEILWNELYPSLILFIYANVMV